MSTHADEHLPALPDTAILAPAAVVEQWPNILQVATAICKSGLAPMGLTPEKVAVLILSGTELGLPPMTSVRELYVVDGKIGMSATLARALVLQRCPGAKIRIVERSGERCRIQVERPEHEPHEVEYTLAEARVAGLLVSKQGKTKTNWKNHPADMLVARATTRALRDYFPDILLGAVYAPDEIEEIRSSRAAVDVVGVEQPAESPPEAPKVDKRNAVRLQRFRDLGKRWWTTWIRIKAEKLGCSEEEATRILRQRHGGDEGLSDEDINVRIVQSYHQYVALVLGVDVSAVEKKIDDDDVLKAIKFAIDGRLFFDVLEREPDDRQRGQARENEK